MLASLPPSLAPGPRACPRATDGSLRRGTADYLITGHWSDKAATEAAAHITVRKIKAVSDDGRVLTWAELADTLNPDAAYVHVHATTPRLSPNHTALR